jgi:glycosyltransferase involved in cell wall biosynthesis
MREEHHDSQQISVCMPAYDAGQSVADVPPSDPQISVCMPVYNAERYVTEAIESVLNQTLGDFEFLIVDDGSTDGTLRILERHAAREPRIRLTSRPNKGLVASLNELVYRARGEFLARMDADDVAMPERFARQVEYLRTHPECVLVGSRAWETDAEGDPIREFPTLSDHDEIDAYHFRIKGPAILHPTVMMRRDVVLAIGGYRDFSLSEEVDLYLRLAERGRLGRVPDYLLKYRVHTTNYSWSAAARERSYRANCAILVDAYRRRQLPVSLPPPEPLPTGPEEPPVARDRMYGWLSLLSGQPRTARKYARRVLARRPFSPHSWKLLYCALRGY